MILRIESPVFSDLSTVTIGTALELSGTIHTARDAVIPKISQLIKAGDIDLLPFNLHGSTIMHTAFSNAGFGPTSSNKEDIENNLGILSEAGVRIHIGKGSLKQYTIDQISRNGSIFVVVPPVSALLQTNLISKKVIAFEEEGMEALYELKIKNLFGIVAAANGQSLFHENN